MSRQFFSGSSLDQAVMQAARHYGVDPEELAYRQLEKRHGFLRSRRAVVIEVDPDNPRAERPAEPEPSPPPVERPRPPRRPERGPDRRPGGDGAVAERPRAAPPAPAATRAAAASGREVGGEEAAAPAPAADPELLGAAERAARQLLEFGGIEAEASARAGEGRLEVEIRGLDDEVLVVEGGKGLLAIQHLLPRMLRGLTGRSSFVRVDCAGFHEERKRRLEELARREAEQVRRTGRVRTLSPMAPDERRIVHLALNDDSEISTESRGGGLFKRVVIRPAGGYEDDD